MEKVAGDLFAGARSERAEAISRITDRVLEEMQDWANRSLDEVYAAVFIDAIVVEGL